MGLDYCHKLSGSMTNPTFVFKLCFLELLQDLYSFLCIRVRAE